MSYYYLLRVLFAVHAWYLLTAYKLIIMEGENEGKYISKCTFVFLFNLIIERATKKES